MALSVEAVTVIKSMLDASGYVAGAKQVSDANTTIASSGDTVTQSQAKFTRSLGDSGAAFDRLRKQVDDTYRVQQQMAAAIAQTNAAVAAGRTTTDTGAATLQAYGDRLIGAKNANQDFTGSAAQARFASRQFEVQMTQMFTSIGSGQPILQSMIQQLHQVLDVAFATGVSMTTMFKTLWASIQSGVSAIGGWTTVVGVGVVGALAAFEIAGEVTERRLLAIQTALRGTHDNFVQLAADVTAAAKAAAATTTISSPDARSAGTILAASPQYTATTQQLQLLIKIANDTASVLGITVPEAAKKFSAAMADPGKVAQEFADKHLFDFNQALARSIELQGAAGDKGGAFLRIMDQVAKSTRGAADDALTPLGKAINNLSNAFHEAGTNGTSFADIVHGITDTLTVAAVDSLTEIVREFKEIYDLIANLKVPKSAGIRTDQGIGQMLSDILDPQRLGTSTGNVIRGGAGYVAQGLQNLPIYDQSGRQVFSPSPNTVPGMLGQIMGPNGLNFNAQEAAIFPSLIQQESSGRQFGPNGGLLLPGGGELSPGQLPPPGTPSGLSQIKPETAARFGFTPGEIATPAGNLGSGGAEFDRLYQKYNGDIWRVLAVYGGWGEGVVDQMTKGAPPPPKFAKYVNDILGRAGIAVPTPGANQPIDVASTLAGSVKTGVDVDEAIKQAQGQSFTKTFQDAKADADKYTAALQALAKQGITTGDSVKYLQEGLMKAQEAEYKAVGPVVDLIRAIDIQIDAAKQLGDAYSGGFTEVAKATILAQAQSDVLAKGINKSMPQYAEAVAATVVELTKLNEQQEINKAHSEELDRNQQIQFIQAETDSIGKNAEQRAVQLAGLKEWQDIEKNMPVLYADSSEGAIKEKNALVDSAKAVADATFQLQQHQGALNELANAFTSAFDTISSAMAQAFVQGQGAAVNWGNVMKAVVQQVISEFLKLSILNPLLNSLFGQNNQTIFSVLGAVLGGGGGIGGATSTGNLTDLISLGSLANQAQIGGDVATGGGNGILGNLLGGARAGSNLFNLAGLFNGGSLSPALDFALADLSPSLFGPGSAAIESTLAAGSVESASSIGSLSSAVGGASISSILGGVGAGFGLGSLGGGLIQGALGKTGPGPTIGAGAGTAAGAAIGSVIPVIGTAIGALIGGLVGGAGGGLIGPKPASAYSLTNLGLDESGMFTIGSSANQSSKTQFAPSNRAVVTAEVNDFNNALKAMGASVNSVTGTFGATGEAFSAGRGTAMIGAVGLGSKNKDDDVVAASLSALFSNMRFTANDPVVKRWIEDKSFASMDALAAAVQQVRTFVDQTVPALLNFGKATGSLNDAIVNLHATFDPAISTAQQMAYKEAELTAARDAAIQKVQDEAAQALHQTNLGITNTALTAQNARLPQGSLAQIRGAADIAITTFDETTAVAARKQLHDQLVAAYGDAFTATKDYGDEMVMLEQSIGQQRFTILQQFEKASEQFHNQVIASIQDNTANYLTAHATVTGNQADALQATVYTFDVQAQRQRDALVAGYDESYRATADYAAQSAALERSLSEQRLAVQKQFNNQSIQQTETQADALVVSLSSYLQKIQFGTQSPLSPMDQYALAQKQFNAASGAAGAGDVKSIQQLPQLSDALLAASRVVNGAGAGYATDFQKVLDAINKAIPDTTDQLTALIFTQETKTQTQILSNDLGDVKALLNDIKTSLNQNAQRPVRAA